VLLRPGDRVALEGDNPKQADFLSRTLAECDRNGCLAGARRWEPLDVTVASHCPLQTPTAERMAAHLAGLPRRPQRVAYLTNTGGRRVRADSAVLDDLAHAVARPVQWYDAMRLMRELGATCAVQMPPGHALAALVARSTPSMYALALADDGIERAVAAGAAL
jgi:malonate decarboxylase epsilon subunit